MLLQEVGHVRIRQHVNPLRSSLMVISPLVFFAQVCKCARLSCIYFCIGEHVCTCQFIFLPIRPTSFWNVEVCVKLTWFVAIVMGRFLLKCQNGMKSMRMQNCHWWWILGAVMNNLCSLCSISLLFKVITPSVADFPYFLLSQLCSHVF